MVSYFLLLFCFARNTYIIVMPTVWYISITLFTDYVPADENSNPAAVSGYTPKPDPISQPSQYLDMSSPVHNAIDNPEYFDRPDDDSVFPSISINDVKSQKLPVQLQNVDSGPTASRHNYYNDFGLPSPTSRPSTAVLPSNFIDPRSESMVWQRCPSGDDKISLLWLVQALSRQF